MLYSWVSLADEWSISTSLTVTKFTPFGTFELFFFLGTDLLMCFLAAINNLFYILCDL